MKCKSIMYLLFVLFIQGRGGCRLRPLMAKRCCVKKRPQSSPVPENSIRGWPPSGNVLYRSPTRAKPHIIMGYLLLEKGDGQQALASFEKALELRPVSSTAKTGKGIILSQAGE